MSRRLWKAERILRCVFKVLEFITSLYFVFVMYHVGPHWVMLAACLAVPIYGLYLVVARSVDPNTNQGLHSIPYLRYKTLVRAKVWQRADIAISVTISIVCIGFSILLFFGYFKIRSATTYFLHSAISALLLAFLYTFDALITVCQLKSGSVAFVKSDKFTKSFPNNGSKHVVQADFTSSFAPSNDFNKAPSSGHHNQQLIQLPNSSSAAVPTILDRLRLEIEAEHKYSTVSYPRQPNQQQRSWFDEERQDELTNSTSLSNASAQQQIDKQQYWEENRQINDLIIVPTKKHSKTTYSRFQQIDEPMELQPTLNLSNSSSRTQVPNKRLDMNSKMSSLEEQLPSPPNSVQPAQRSTKRPVIVPVNQYKISSYPYSRKAIYPANDHQKQQLYTQIPQNRSTSNRNSETTDTSVEDLNMKSRLNFSNSQQNPTVLNYPLDLNVHTSQPRPAPLIFYKTTQAHVHPPVKARMVTIEDDAELSNQRPGIEETSRGSSKSSATARIDDFEHTSQSSSTRPSISSTLVHMNASH